jgi:hypothetical protein
MAQDTPNSYKDPFWQGLASNTEEKLGLPKGILQSVLLYGEKSNADQVSEAGAKTPFQIIPQTRQGIIKNYGIDPYLSPALASEGAGLLLKESLQRNNGDVNLAIREYHGGVDKKNWGPVNQSYGQRVLKGISELIPAAQAAGLPTGSMEMNILQAYRDGRMSPEEKTEFERDVNSGTFTLPAGEAIGSAQAGSAQAGSSMLPMSVVKAYKDGRMTAEEKLELERDVNAGSVSLPTGVSLQAAPDRGIIGSIVESVTGTERATPESRALPEYTGMPELNTLSMASFKSGVGTLLTSPEETVQVLQSNFPNLGVRKDAKGNFILRSTIDQQEYVIPPGFSMGDVPRAIGGLAAFTPAGRATSLLGAGAAGAVTQAAIEGTQALTGGTVNPAEVALAGAFGAGGQALAKGAGALAQRVRGAPTQQVAKVADEVIPVNLADEVIPPSVAGVADQVPPRMQGIEVVGKVADEIPSPAAGVTVPTAPEAAQELGTLIRKASEDGFGSSAAKAKLADQAQINPEARQAAERLGIDVPFDVLSDNPQIRSAAGLTRSVAGSEAEASWVNTLRNSTQRADDVIQQFDAVFIEGRPSTGAVSDQVLESLKKTRQALDDDAKAFYNQVDESISKSQKVQMPNLSATLVKVLDEVGEAGISAQEKRLLTMLNEEVTYGRLLREKNLIGKALAGQESPYGSMELSSLKRLYGSLAQDQLDAVEQAAGEGVRKQLRAANLLTAQKKALENRIVAAYGKETDGSVATLMQSAITQAAKGNANQFNKLMKVVPEDLRKEVVATALASVATSNRAVGGGAFGFAEYTKVFRGLRSNPKVYAEVVKTLGQGSDKVLRDLYEVSKRITDARAQVLTTGKANQALLNSMTAESIVGKVLQSSISQRLATGAASLVPGGGLVAPDIIKYMSQGGKDRVKAAADLFADKDFQKMVTEAATEGEPFKASIQKLATNQKFAEFSRKNGIGKSLQDKINYLTTAVQASRQFESESE